MENKARGSFIALVLIIAILGMAYFTFGSVSDSIDGTSAANNVTAGYTNTVSGIIPVAIMLVAIALAVGFIAWYVRSAENYQKANNKIQKLLDFLDMSVYYFAYGCLAYVIFGTVAFSVYLVYRLTVVAGETGAGIALGKIALIAVVVFFGTAGIGYLFKKYIWDKWQERKAEKQRLQLINEELPGVNID